ncbi:GNAT family N-acetyltransferase [Streptomyces violarus]|uniref:GNAT superfamily N-acetyltransferase n=1 Tax=Streptomyces violarus TaxID=67380 RepID=A0A7W5F016_9ACTN|nr:MULTISPECIES: GNAT family N-acetyltransferase [Streptomyces]MBB3075000.1 GNAT superfamily N-acetyltransferase [Streptomyces violarus]WRT97639.1 GNAT family N-acetyltransferase [Streptomyces sp. CGMCC 4.1772]
MGDIEPGALVLRRAEPADRTALAGTDPIAAAGDPTRRASIRRWCEQGLALLAEDSRGPVGYGVLEYTFFEQGFLTLLTVVPGARRQGVATRLLTAVEAACTTPKLFTSTNVSNQPMQQLLLKSGWRPAGLVHGLDEGDPELFYLCPSENLSLSSTLRTFPDTVIGKESRI